MKTLSGKIVSLKNQKTAMVEVERFFKHPLYKKYLKRNKKYACHLDDSSLVTLNQKVTIVSCRPLSKTKKFKILTAMTKKEK